jgi:hypothetical protein
MFPAWNQAQTLAANTPGVMAAWWAIRPLWILIYLLALLPFARYAWTECISR